MTKPQDIILEARDVAVTFKVEGGDVKAVRNVNFALRKGETIAIVGESGSGKSVTARAIMRLLSKRATMGTQSSIIMDGQDVVKLPEREMRKLRGSKDIAMIFQEPMTSLNPVYTVGAADLRSHPDAQQDEPGKDAMAKALEALLEGSTDPRARGAPQATIRTSCRAGSASAS